MSGEKSFQRGAIEVRSGVAAVVVTLRQCCPPGLTLTENIRLGGFALGIERVEIAIESFLGRFPGIDGAAHHFSPLRFAAIPKKAYPFHCVPVTCRAIALSDL